MIADMMEEWFTTGAADGFNIQPPCIPVSAEDFVELVTPELQRRGLFRTEYETTTLREHLGLKPATNRHAMRRSARRPKQKLCQASEPIGAEQAATGETP
jgi:N-acetyl-S-(2-succino)cysteine monooxygenase